MIFTYILYVFIIGLLLAVLKVHWSTDKEINSSKTRLQNLKHLYESALSNGKQIESRLTLNDQLTKKMMQKSFLSTQELIGIYELIQKKDL